MPPNIKSKTARTKLPAKSAPYYTPLAEGLSIGWRKQTEGKPGSWIARLHIDGKHVTKALGRADDAAPADGEKILNHDQAVAKAHGMTDAGAAATLKDRLTVHEAITAWERRKTRAARTPKARQMARFNGVYLRKAFSETLLVADTTKAKVQAWFDGMCETDDPDRARARQATAGRHLANLRAALNASAPKGMARPWQEVKRPTLAKVGQARTRVLSQSEEAALLAAAPTMLARFITFALATGARPGEIGSLNVGDMDIDLGVAHLRHGKTGPRNIQLSARLMERIRAERWIGNREPHDPFIPTEAGARCIDGAWIDPFAETCSRAQVEGATMYVCRHTAITRLAEAGAPISWISEQVGSSEAMLRRTYVHFRREAAAGYLDAAGL